MIKWRGGRTTWPFVYEINLMMKKSEETRYWIEEEVGCRRTEASCWTMRIVGSSDMYLFRYLLINILSLIEERHSVALKRHLNNKNAKRNLMRDMVEKEFSYLYMEYLYTDQDRLAWDPVRWKRTMRGYILWGFKWNGSVDLRRSDWHSLAEQISSVKH